MSTVGAQSFSPNFGINLGPTGATLIFPCGNSGTILINTIAKNKVPFLFSGTFTVRTVGTGTASTAWGIWKFQSEALLNSPLPTIGGSTQYLQIPTTPAASSGFDYSAVNILNVVLTTNLVSLATVKQYMVEALN